MRLGSFSLQKFRSIQKAERVILGDLTVLIGPNNEGKTNILNGLVSGMQMLARFTAEQFRPERASQSYAVTRNVFDWNRDFPIALQTTRPDGLSIFDYVFELTPDEVELFRVEVKSNLNGSLPIRLSVGQNQVKFEVRKKGPGGPALSKKRSEIATFVAERINVRAIPAVRTSVDSARLVDEMVERALGPVERSPEYVKAVQQIAEIQQPILDSIGANLKGMMQLFLPQVTGVRIDVEDRLRALRRNTRIFVDDGTETELRRKGDGVQSLAALALIHQVAKDRAGARELILAVEEPEAHLHPRAIHQLRAVLTDIASTQQVILTTHSPLFVNRSDIGSNVIVDKSRARPAKTVAEIRETLGVRVSDNLTAAEVVLMCEGECDRIVLAAVLPSFSEVVRDAFEHGRLAVDSLQGGTNLRYKLALYRDQLCATHSFLDHDAAGIDAAMRAELEGLSSPADVTYATCPGLAESELEDLLDMSLVLGPIRTRYNVDLAKVPAAKKKRKWSERAEAAFLHAGQHWDDKVCVEVKTLVAQIVAVSPDSAVRTELAGSVQGLVTALEAKLA